MRARRIASTTAGSGGVVALWSKYVRMIDCRLQTADCRVNWRLTIADCGLDCPIGGWIGECGLGIGLKSGDLLGSGDLWVNPRSNPQSAIAQSNQQSLVPSPIPIPQWPIHSAICNRQSSIVLPPVSLSNKRTRHSRAGFLYCRDPLPSDQKQNTLRETNFGIWWRVRHVETG